MCKTIKGLLALAVLTFVACKSSRSFTFSALTEVNYRSSYDRSTLAVDNKSVLMPYNRFIDPAGTVVRFGNPSLENHSLDCILLPGNRVLAVEDRYGLAFIDVDNKSLIFHLDYSGSYASLMSTYSGLKVLEEGGLMHIYWGASSPATKASFIMEATWDGEKARIADAIAFQPVPPSPMALPNDIAVSNEGGENYLYVVLNGNSQLSKIRMRDKSVVWTAQTGMAPFGVALTATKAYVTNWAGPVPVDNTKETAGIPYANAYIDPRTGATATGSVSVIDRQTGLKHSDIEVGLHPNAIIANKQQDFVYVANGNSDYVSVISTATDKVADSVSVRLGGNENKFIGDSPNALALNNTGTTLYVSNGMDNAIAVIRLGSNVSSNGLGKSYIEGFIPTEAYPAGLVIANNALYVANLEGEGVGSKGRTKFSSHEQEATISIIPVPDKTTLAGYTKRVEAANLMFRTKIARQLPKAGVAPKPVPERIGEPSVFKHVVYIIKENKTYDQVFGDMPEGNGMKSLCIFGNEVTPNQHKLAKEFSLLDNFYASGKSSAEGHSWADAAIVTDYVEKNVRAWFRSYPHVFQDALVYNKEGFIWNNALDHGKTVRVYGEGCIPQLPSGSNWTSIYQAYMEGKKIDFRNESTISRLRPIMSESYPCYEGARINDQIRADEFINELKHFEQKPGDQLPQLMILALPADHTAGLSPGFPTPRAMVADNDLALGRIIEALTKSRFWDSTAVFVIEDDSQSGWDHVSGYRTTGFVLSPYSRLKKVVHTNYNQTSIVRTIEQILGIPPTNMFDATALPMFDCFTGNFDKTPYQFIKNNVPLNEMNKTTASLQGKAKKFSILSASQFEHIDAGDDDLLNRILWFAAKGNKRYPKNMTVAKKDRRDDD